MMIHKNFNLKLATHRHKIYTQGHLHPGTDITRDRHLKLQIMMNSQFGTTSLLTTEITASSYSTIHRS